MEEPVERNSRVCSAATLILAVRCIASGTSGFHGKLGFSLGDAVGSRNISIPIVATTVIPVRTVLLVGALSPRP